MLKQRKIKNQNEVEAAALNRIISLLSISNDLLIGAIASLNQTFQLDSFWYSLARLVL